MGIEEQQEEREVLESIFPDEITGSSVQEPLLNSHESLDVSETEFRVSIRLDVTNSGGESDEEESPIIQLKVEYPPSYPDEAPRLDLLSPPNAPKYTFFDLQDDKANLLESLDPVVAENLGMAMVFTLVSSLKDAAELLISERQNAAQAVKEVEAAKVEAEENKKFHGTPVNAETFLSWRKEFREEMAREEARRKEEQEAEDKKKRIKEEIRLTGRQLWERGLAGKGEEEEDGEDALAAVVGNVKIGA